MFIRLLKTITKNRIKIITNFQNSKNYIIIYSFFNRFSQNRFFGSDFLRESIFMIQFGIDSARRIEHPYHKFIDCKKNSKRISLCPKIYLGSSYSKLKI